MDLITDFIIDNITKIMLAGVALSVPIVINYKKKHQFNLQTVFLTTQFKTKFKKHQNNFNEQFKEGHSLFK
ncbi:MAG TPA: hypothetical protein VIM70_06495 [Clostridium sp.]|uniref:hypothetical protein n=1 Tax=Clostridium sp. TaxID=1506 RepID=UPI002F91F7B6